MSTTILRPMPPRSLDRSIIVERHKSYRGLRIEQNLLSQFTMYTVELDRFGLFISDSRREAFNMAFEALFSPPRPGSMT